jgi:flagellar assembly factor FliW
MPEVQTKYFGAMACPPDSEFEFPAGLPGFEAERRFVFLERPDADPLLFLQSLSNPNLCLILLPVLVADREYRLALTAEDLAALRLPVDRQPEIGKDILCAVVVCAGDECRPVPTVNLMAPIVVNLHQRIGMQVIQTEFAYPYRQPLFPSEELVSCS